MKEGASIASKNKVEARNLPPQLVLALLKRHFLFFSLVFKYLFIQ